MTSTGLCTYTVRVFREDDLWVIEAPELDTASQSRTLASAKEEARTLVAAWLDVPPDQVAVRMDFIGVDPETWHPAYEARSAQEQTDESIRCVAASQGRATQRLVGEGGLDLRDVTPPQSSM